MNCQSKHVLSQRGVTILLKIVDLFFHTCFCILCVLVKKKQVDAFLDLVDHCVCMTRRGSSLLLLLPYRQVPLPTLFLFPCHVIQYLIAACFAILCYAAKAKLAVLFSSSFLLLSHLNAVFFPTGMWTELNLRIYYTTAILVHVAQVWKDDDGKVQMYCNGASVSDFCSVLFCIVTSSAQVSVSQFSIRVYALCVYNSLDRIMFYVRAYFVDMRRKKHVLDNALMQGTFCIQRTVYRS